MSRHVFLATIVVIGLSAANLQAEINRVVKTNRNSAAPPIARVCLVSLEAQMNQVGMKGTEPLLSESEECARKLHDTLTHAISGAGWTLARDFFGSSHGADERLRQTVLRIKKNTTASPCC